MLNTRAKCNILPTKTTKTLGYIINNISTFTIFTTIRHKFSFASVAQIKIEIAKGVRYKDLFFLVDKAPKTLLKMPFIRKMKLSFTFNKDSSLNKTFTNLGDPTNSYTIIIVLLLKTTSKKKV